jgi:hypothetical protein
MLNNYTVLLQLDIHTLQQLCYTNQYTLMLCHNLKFWIDKFEHDNLVIPDDNLLNGKNMIKSYQILKNITYKLNKIQFYKNIYDNVTLHGKELKNLLYTFMITDPPTLLSFKMFEWNFNRIKIVQINKTMFEIIFLNRSEEIQRCQITLQELINLLFIGHYNDIIMLDY